MSIRSAYHENHECEHDVDYCKKCNEVYCVDCEMTWVLACTESHITFTTTTDDPGYGTTTVSDSTVTIAPQTGDDIHAYTTSCTHE